MLSEYEIRRLLNEVERSPLAPRQRVRRLVWLSRLLHNQVRKLRRVASLYRKKRDSRAAITVERLAHDYEHLRSEVRSRAVEEIHAVPRRRDEEREVVLTR